MNDVAAAIPAKWRQVGVQLKLPSEVLDEIQNQNAGKIAMCKISFEQVFTKWERLGTSPHTWETMVKVLGSPAVGEVDLAGQLSSKYVRLRHCLSLDSPELQDLMNDVAAAIPAKWRLVGVQLKLPSEVLDKIQDQNAGKTDICKRHSFEQVFTKWERLGTSPHTWETMVKVLGSPAVGEVDLAGQLSSKYVRLRHCLSLDSPELQDLMNDVAAAIPAKWRLVGVQLKLPSEVLDKIQDQNAGKTDICKRHSFEQVFTKWERLGTSPHTWETMVKVLGSPAVGEVDLAGQLSSKYVRLRHCLSLDSPELQDLMNDVAAAIPAKWRKVGVQLKLPSEVLDEIQDQNAGKADMCKLSFEQVFTKWERFGTSSHTWETMVNVLRSPAVGEVDLAGQLSSKYVRLQ